MSTAYQSESRGRSLLAFALGVGFLIVLGLPFLLRRSQEEAAVSEEKVVLPARKLVIISPHWEGYRREIEEGFSSWTARSAGHATEIEWLDLGGTSDAVRYVKGEFKRSPQGIKIDIFYGGGIDPYLEFARRGILTPCEVPQEVLGAIPPTIANIPVYDPGKRWFGAALAGFGIVYNKKVLEIMGLPEPSTWEDLGRPVYFTWVGSGDPRSSGSVHMVYEIILQAYGWRKGWENIVRMGGNIRGFSRSASQVPKNVAIGEVACGMAIDTYAWREIAEVGHERMGFILPDGLTVVNPDAIAVLKGAPNRKLAERFVAFVLSERGQKLLILKVGAKGGPRRFQLNRLAVIPGLAEQCGNDAVVPLDPFSFKGGIQYDANKSYLRWGILNDLLGACVIDPHRDLVEAWRRVKDAPPADARLRKLLSPPVGEEELLILARDRWQHAELRAKTVSQWAAEARARYRQVAGEN